jgi:M6 family metalloprotease-like protein
MRSPCRILLSLILFSLLSTSNLPFRASPGMPASPPPMGSGAGEQSGGSDVWPRAIGYPIPRAGDQKLLVVLADFPGKPGLFTGQQWHDFFFGANGFASYYREASYSQLRYTGDIVGLHDGAPVVNSNGVDYVPLPQPISYYADGQYGYKIGYGQFPRNIGGAVWHALQALDNAGFDFAPYANPGTGMVENLLVIFAGASYGYTHDPNHSLEATAYTLSWMGAGTYQSRSGQRFDNYTFCPDQSGIQGGQIARIGICTHEHGHALGMVDLYDFSYTTSGVGYFDLMAYGTYGATAGLRPFRPGAFSEEFFGWITPQIAPPGTITVTLGPVESDAHLIKLYPDGDGTNGEYFLLENRQPLGFDQDWASAGLCPGLLIWHVDSSVVQSSGNKVNTLPSAGGPPHQGVVLVEADGDWDLIRAPLRYGECSDTWTVGRIWDASSMPSSRLWNGRDSHLSVTVLSANQGSVTLRVTVGVGRAYLYLPTLSR